MKIKRSSWHYRYLSNFGVVENSWQAENLCKYFWKTVFFCTVIPTIAVLLAIFASIPFWIYLVLLDADWWVLSALAGIADIIVLGFLWQQYRDYLRKVGKLAPKKSKPYVPKEPSLFVQWLKAKKQKICPIIEFD